MSYHFSGLQTSWILQFQKVRINTVNLWRLAVSSLPQIGGFLPQAVEIFFSQLIFRQLK